MMTSEALATVGGKDWEPSGLRIRLRLGAHPARERHVARRPLHHVDVVLHRRVADHADGAAAPGQGHGRPPVVTVARELTPRACARARSPRCTPRTKPSQRRACAHALADHPSPHRRLRWAAPAGARRAARCANQWRSAPAASTDGIGAVVGSGTSRRGGPSAARRSSTSSLCPSASSTSASMHRAHLGEQHGALVGDVVLHLLLRATRDARRTCSSAMSLRSAPESLRLMSRCSSVECSTSLSRPLFTAG